MTTQPLPSNFTADTFIVWALAQPNGSFELVQGEVIAMSPERAGHARAKLGIVSALASAISRAGLDCEAFTDGMTVRIDESTGKRVTSGGARYPFLEGTVPESTGFAAGQIDASDPTEL